MTRIKVLLWFPFLMLYFPMLIILGEDRTDDIGIWIQDL